MLGELLGFLGDVLVDMILQPLLGALLGALVRGVRILLYPLLLGVGWVGAWGTSNNSFGELWQIHGPGGLHRLGWQRALLTAEYSTAGLLIGLAMFGIGAVLYGISKVAGS